MGLFEKLNHINLSGEEYPIKCDILVLEQIQDKYGDLSKFENDLIGFVPSIGEDGLPVKNEEGLVVGMSGTPDVKVIRDALIWMIREGEEIDKEENGKEREILTDNQILRRVDMSPKELGKALREEFNRCFVRKNARTTQEISKTTEKPDK